MNDSLAGIRFFYNIKWPQGFACEECGSSHYIYDEKKHQAIGRRKNKRYRLGDHLEVVVARVDREKRELDLLPADKFNLKTRRGKRKK